MVNPQLIRSQRAGIGASSSSPIPAPTGGWNTRDAKSKMDASDALVLTNLFPGNEEVELIKGFESYATGMATNIEMLADYHAGSVHKFIAAAGGSLFDISTSGVATSIGSGFASARWEPTLFNGYLLLYNNTDTPQKYDGTTLAALAITGLTMTTIICSHVYRSRQYLVQANSQSFWYGGVNSIEGAFTEFPLSRVVKKGGNLVAIKSITRDGGAGSDDIIAFFMSTGEVVVYQGGNPGDATDFMLQGVYTTGAPVHRRAFVEHKGDVIYLTKADVVSLLQAMVEGGFNAQPSKLVGAIAQAVRDYGDNYGWQAIKYPNGNRILFNIPIASNVEYEQYGFNTNTQAPFRMTGHNARCLGIYNDDLYFGGNGVVYKANTGFDHDGASINIVGQQAYSNLGVLGRKTVTMLRPIYEMDGAVTLNQAVAYDYGDVFFSSEAASTSDGAAWDEVFWDAEFWSPEGTTRQGLQASLNEGVNVSIKIEGSLNGQDFKWFETSYYYKQLARF